MNNQIEKSYYSRNADGDRNLKGLKLCNNYDQLFRKYKMMKVKSSLYRPILHSHISVIFSKNLNHNYGIASNTENTSQIRGSEESRDEFHLSHILALCGNCKTKFYITVNK